MLFAELLCDSFLFRAPEIVCSGNDGDHPVEILATVCLDGEINGNDVRAQLDLAYTFSEVIKL